MRDVTKRQVQVLRFIAEFWREHGYPPTLREIATHLGINSTNGVSDHLVALERRGLIRRAQFDSRGLTILRAGWAAIGVFGCPMCGHSAEKPAAAE